MGFSKEKNNFLINCFFAFLEKIFYSFPESVNKLNIIQSGFFFYLAHCSLLFFLVLFHVAFWKFPMPVCIMENQVFCRIIFHSFKNNRSAAFFCCHQSGKLQAI